MPKLPETSLKSIRGIAKYFGLKIARPHPGSPDEVYDVDGRMAKIYVLYHGGDTVAKHVEGVDLALVRAGHDGEWLAILPARTIFELISDSKWRGKFPALQNSTTTESEGIDASEQQQ